MSTLPTAYLKDRVIKILAGQIGVETDDINDADSLREDLHMSSSDLTDLLDLLEKGGFDVSGLELASIETVEDLVDTLSLMAE